MSLSLQDESSLSSEDEAEMSEPAWLAADLGVASDLSPPTRAERMRRSPPPAAHGKEEDGKELIWSGTPPALIVSDQWEGVESFLMCLTWIAPG